MKANRVKVLALALVVLSTVFVAAAGCGGGGCAPQVSDSQAREIIARAEDASQNVQSYQFDMSLTSDATLTIGSQTTLINLAVTGSGALDFVNKEMTMNISTAFAPPGETEQIQIEAESYIVDETQYTKVRMLGEDSWTKMIIPDFPNYWTAQEKIEWTLWKEAIKLESLPDEAVEGVDSSVIKATPDREKLRQAMLQQWQPGAMMPGEMSSQELAQAMKDMSLKIWLAKDTDLPVKTQMQMTLGMSGGMLTPPQEGEVAMTMQMDMKFYGYNQPVSIELPPGAENAVEIPWQ